jgi:intracellular sulfur oxidation DsrE/DsrF family protein
VIRKAIVIHGESMGDGPADLGATLMVSFLRHLAMAGWRPDAIAFYNAGVKLLLASSAASDPLRRLADLGVDLVACGTCVAYFDLPREALVGRVGTMQEIVSILGEAESVITL